MKRIILMASVFVLLHGWSSIAQAMRIDSVSPNVVERGDEVIIRGRDFGASRGKQLTIWRVVNQQPQRYVMEFSEWRDTLIRARIPFNVPPDRCGIYIRVPGREFLSSNTVPVTVRQPPPPAAPANLDLVMENECQAVSTRIDGQYERSTVRECPRPVQRIWMSDARAARPGGYVVLGDAGASRNDLVIALVDVENVRDRRGNSERFYVRRLLRNFGGRNGYLSAGLPEDLPPGRYSIALLYRYPARERTRPSFMKGSNALWFEVRR